jgi:putative membrane protein
MKTLSIAVAVLSLVACDRPRDRDKDTMDTARPRNEELPRMPQSGTPPTHPPDTKAETARMSDQEFVTKATVGGKFEIDSSQAALSQGISGSMKTFAERMVKDHGAANKELEALAKDKGWELPADLDANHRSMMDEIRKAPATDLSSVYHRIHLSAHEEAMDLFEQCADSCADADLKSFADETLQVIRSHHAELRKVSEVTH